MDNSLKISVPIIVMLAVIMIMLTTLTVWNASNTQFMTSMLMVGKQEQTDVNAPIRGKEYPVIKAENIRIKKGEDLDLRDYISAEDKTDGDISNRLEFYGSVDTQTKGIYKVRCVVRNSLGLKTTEYIQVVVD